MNGMMVEGIRYVGGESVRGAGVGPEGVDSSGGFSRELDKATEPVVNLKEWLDPTKLGLKILMLDLDPMTLDRVLERASRIETMDGFKAVALSVDGEILAPKGTFSVVVEARRLEVLREQVAQAQGKEEALGVVRDYARGFGVDLSDEQASALVYDILGSLNYDAVVSDWAKLYLEARKNDMEKTGMMAFGGGDQELKAGLSVPTEEDKRILERDGHVARWDELRRVGSL